LKGTSPELINTDADRRKLLQELYGINLVLELPFDEHLRSMPWQDFLMFLQEKHPVGGFVCGEDFRFGYKGEGNAQKLLEFCREQGLSCCIVPEQKMDGIRISSTYIRQLLKDGKMEQACAFLGHPHILTGQVQAGQKLGRTIGIPTANIHLPEGVVVPKFGVYACRICIGNEWKTAVTNVGTRPTVEGKNVTVEPWILDFQGDLYGKTITLEFYRFLRPERKFDDLEQLKERIHLDRAETEKYFHKQ
jgi:riboflavin kinase/FMN adenylyltransferase